MKGLGRRLDLMFVLAAMLLAACSGNGSNGGGADAVGETAAGDTAITDQGAPPPWDVPPPVCNAGNKKCMMGNFDPLDILRDATPEVIRKETTSMIEKNKKGGGYIFCTSEGITQNTPVENMMAMMEAARQCAAY